MLSLLVKGQAFSIAKELNVSYKTVVNACSRSGVSSMRQISQR
jgi:uncharacterized protein YqkB